ncbi:zinc finger protein 12 [Nilaparvata lugens]|uniref:zinc finger protein 12 n=1 Tax=Nilaparvata lugens TaxID=108931 RepID=UPI000B98AB78|nr:zinc finger protein 12 [Nilaparvata lugens]
MTDLCKENFDQICRLCSSSISSVKHQIYGKLEIFTTITECLQIKTENDDGLPSNICDTCLTSLQNLKQFRAMCYSTQTKLLTCIGVNGEQVHKKQVKNDSMDESENADPDPQSTLSSDNEDMEIKENGLEESLRLPELSEPGPEDYVLMKEETFSLDASRDGNSSRSSLGAILADHLIEFNNNNNNSSATNNNSSGTNGAATTAGGSSSPPPPLDKDRDLVDGQKLRKDVLAPMWDVFEKIWPRKDSTNGGSEKTMVRVVHRRYVVSKLAFPCSLCGECFKFDQGYERGGTPDSKSYDCNTCGKVFPKRIYWKLHQATHEDVKPFVCRMCGKGFDRKDHLTRHLYTHGSLRLRQTAPPDCSSDAPAASAVKQFACTRCAETFGRREHLTRHMKRAHNIDLLEEADLRKFPCDVCHKAFTRREHLRRHQHIHQKENPAALFMEVQASEGVAEAGSEEAVSPPHSPSEASSHKMAAAVALSEASSHKMAAVAVSEERVVTTGKKPTIVNCHICSKGFSRRSHLSRHLKQVHKAVPETCDEVHRCEECGKQFGRRYHLERHAKIHQASRPPPGYECVTCGEAFTQSEALDKHMTSTHGNQLMHDFLWM